MGRSCGQLCPQLRNRNWSRNIEAIGRRTPYYYTLNLHRTLFSHRAFTVAYEGREEEAFVPSVLQKGVISTKVTSIGFLFTGQGAQWVGMGMATLQTFPIILDTIQKLDSVLARIHPKPSFKIAELLLEDDKSKASRMNDAEITQPLCTAIQIALIGAAYAAGLISAPEAILAAFCRGRAVAQKSTLGSMLAVGLGVEEVQQFLPSAAEDACIACENSPNSVTVSGTAISISKLRDDLDSKGFFTRELNMGKAYHSPHMTPVGAAYDIMLSETLTKLTENDLLWSQPRSQMISSVTGEPVVGNDLAPGYWSANLQQRVLFNTAIQRLGAYSQFEHVDLVNEVGPHSALLGPFKQICKLLSVAGLLFLTGYPVDLEEVNLAASSDTGIRKPTARNLLVDLPPYQWNYKKHYWVWRNVLRYRDVPWLNDHNLGGTAIFPAAGHLSIAIEALRQVHETEGQPIEGVTLRDVNIKTALVIPDSNDGVETILRLQKATDRSQWHLFAVESLTDGVCIVHCEGRISATHQPTIPRTTPMIESALTQRVSGKRWYNAFDSVGFYYGKTFQQLQSVRTNPSIHQATGEVKIAESSGAMKGESRYFIHPSSVDACLQLIIISIHAGKHKEMPWGVVPTRIEEVSLFPVGHDAASTGLAVAWNDDHNEREFNTDVRLTGPGNRVLLDIKNLTCITYEAAIPASTLEKGTDREPFSVVSWKSDIKTIKPDFFERMWPGLPDSVERLGKLMELVSHRQHLGSTLLCSSPTPKIVEMALNVLPDTTTITIGYYGEQELHLSTEAKTLVVDNLYHQSGNFHDALMPLVKNGGWLLGLSQQFSSVPKNLLQLDEHFALLKTDVYTNGTILGDDAVTFLSLQGSSDLRDVVSASSVGIIVREKSIQQFSPEQDLRVVIDDTKGTLFSAMSSDTKVFEALKTILVSGVPTLWLTQGVKQGRSASAGMAEGLLRTLRSEQAAARIALLDIDYGETPEDVGKVITSKLETADTKDSGQDKEFWLHKGVLHICRVYPHGGFNKNESQAQETLLPRGVPLKAESAEGQLIFEPYVQRTSVLDCEVEAQVLASELQRSTSGSQLLFCGSVLRVGSSTDQSRVGRRIVAFSYDGLETVVYTSTYAVLDEDERASPETILSSLLPLYPIVYLCLYRNNMAQGVTLFLLPGPKPFMTTITRLAKARGWKLNIIADSSKERDGYISQFSLNTEQVVLSEHETVSTFIRGKVLFCHVPKSREGMVFANIGCKERLSWL
ncbi:polyketide synthase dehydratase-domain-containing protein [Usnea florida]